LDRISEEPGHIDRQEILKAERTKILGEDQEFGAKSELPVTVVQATASVSITATDAGVVAVGSVTEWAGRDAVRRNKIGREQLVEIGLATLWRPPITDYYEKPDV
jgi:hypothetical protein